MRRFQKTRILPALKALERNPSLPVDEVKKLILPPAKELLKQIAEAYKTGDPEKIKKLIAQVNTLGYVPPTTARWLLGLYGIYKKEKFKYVDATGTEWSIPQTGYKYASSKWSEEVIQQAMYFLLSLTLYNMFYKYSEQTEVDTYNLALEQTFYPIWKELTTVREIRDSTETSEYAIQQMKEALQKFGILDESDQVKRIESSEYVLAYIAASRYINFYLIKEDFDTAEKVYLKWLNKFDWASLLSRQWVKYDDLHADFQGLRVVYTYLPLKEYYTDEFVVPLNRYGNVEKDFLLLWGRSVVGAEPLTPDELQKESREILEGHFAPFPYTDRKPVLHLQDQTTWNAVKERIFSFLDRYFNMDQRLKSGMYEIGEGETEAIFDKLYGILLTIEYFVMRGVFLSDQYLAIRGIEREKLSVENWMRGMSQEQYENLRPFLLYVGLLDEDSKMTRILNLKWRGVEGTILLQYPVQKYILSVLYSLVKMIDILILADNVEIWSDWSKASIVNVSNANAMMEQFEKEFNAPQDGILTTFLDWLQNVNPRQFSTRTDPKETRRLVVNDAYLRQLEIRLNVLKGKTKRLSNSLGFDIINAVESIFASMGVVLEQAESMNFYQRTILEKALELSGQKGISKWELFDEKTPPRILKEDIMYLRVKNETVPVSANTVEKVIRVWTLFVNVLLNLFANDKIFDKKSIDKNLTALEDLAFASNPDYKMITSHISVPNPLVSDNHVDWDYSASPAIIEPILARVQNLSLEQRQRLLEYITMDQMVAIGMIRPDIGFVTGITHSTHPALTTKYIVGHQNPLTGYYDFRLDLDSELRLLNKWQIVSKLLEQLERGEPADPVLQKQLNESR